MLEIVVILKLRNYNDRLSAIIDILLSIINHFVFYILIAKINKFDNF